MSFCRKVVVLVALVIICFTRVNGHGRLWEPPSRGSMWRRGYNTSININDNELSCGGFTVSAFCFLLLFPQIYIFKMATCLSTGHNISFMS